MQSKQVDLERLRTGLRTHKITLPQKKQNNNNNTTRKPHASLDNIQLFFNLKDS